MSARPDLLEPPMRPTAVVFDLGNVLIRWAPERAIAHHIPDRDAALAFLDRVGFAAWNLEQDRGRPLADALPVIEAAHPGAGTVLADYATRFAETIREPVPGSWEIAEALAAGGTPLHAITNWSAETFPAACALYPRLDSLFGMIVVSGAEGVVKPDPAIYRLLLDRTGLSAGDCLFIDDSAKNVAGARAVGMAAHHFTDAAGLEAVLRDYDLL
jgi:2-haloacid dehalogenase